MLNFEKYIDETLDVIVRDKSCGYLLKIAGKRCLGFDCTNCKEYLKDWLLSEYKKPEVDWSMVKKDSLIIVWDKNTPHTKFLRYFKGIDNDRKIEAYTSGCTSRTSFGVFETWDFAELVEE